jgi:hypothetical protein
VTIRTSPACKNSSTVRSASRPSVVVPLRFSGRTDVVTLGKIRTAAAAKEGRIVRIARYRFAIVDDSAIVFSLRILRRCEILPDACVCGGKFQRLCIIFDCAVVVAQGSVGKTAIVPTPRIFRVEPKCVGVVGDGVLVVVLCCRLRRGGSGPLD